MYYYIILLVLSFSSIIDCSLPEKTLSAESSNLALPKELKLKDQEAKPVHSVSLIDDSDDEHHGKKTAYSPTTSKLLVIANVAEARRRLSQSMEKSRRQSSSGLQVGDQMPKNDTSMSFSSSERTMLAAAAETPKASLEEVKK
jgi:hypothetical protein